MNLKVNLKKSSIVSEPVNLTMSGSRVIKTQVFDSTRMKHEQIKQQPPVKMKGQVKHEMQERGGGRRVLRDRVESVKSLFSTIFFP